MWTHDPLERLKYLAILVGACKGVYTHVYVHTCTLSRGIYAHNKIIMMNVHVHASTAYMYMYIVHVLCKADRYTVYTVPVQCIYSTCIRIPIHMHACTHTQARREVH